jgi:hypothetical protein
LNLSSLLSTYFYPLLLDALVEQVGSEDTLNLFNSHPLSEITNFLEKFRIWGQCLIGNVREHSGWLWLRRGFLHLDLIHNIFHRLSHLVRQEVRAASSKYNAITTKAVASCTTFTATDTSLTRFLLREGRLINLESYTLTCRFTSNVLFLCIFHEHQSIFVRGGNSSTSTNWGGCKKVVQSKLTRDCLDCRREIPNMLSPSNLRAVLKKVIKYEMLISVAIR